MYEYILKAINDKGKEVYRGTMPATNLGGAVDSLVALANTCNRYRADVVRITLDIALPAKAAA